MEITKGQKRMLIALSAVVAFAAYDFISNSDTYLSFYSGKQTAAPKTNIPKTQNVEEAKDSRNMEFYTKWGTDPFAEIKKEVVVRRVERPVQTGTTFRLSAISYMGNNSVALINDNVVKIGEQIAGYMVSSIEPKRVILIKDSERLVLNLQIAKE